MRMMLQARLHTTAGGGGNVFDALPGASGIVILNLAYDGRGDAIALTRSRSAVLEAR